MSATNPGFFVTLLCQRDEESDNAAQVMAHLTRLEEEGGLGLHKYEEYWGNTSSQILALRFPDEVLRKLELEDLELVQLSINPGGDVASGWRHAKEKLERAMESLSVPLLGRTLVYQAALDDGTPDEALATLLNQLQLLSSDRYFLTDAYAASDVPGGKLWLLETANKEKDTVYLALGPTNEQDMLNAEILFGYHAALISPDAVAHKAYFMARDYLGNNTRKFFRQTSQTLMNKTVAVLQQNGSSNSAELSHLSSQVANLTTVTAELRRLQSDLKVHRLNFHRSLKGSQLSGPVMAYHRLQMNNILFRIKEDLTDAKAVLEAANTAINTLRTQYEQQQAEYERQQAEEERKQTQIEKKRAEQQARTDYLTQSILAVLGMALAVGQIVDANQQLMFLRFKATVVAAVVTAFFLFLLWLVRNRK